MLPIFQNRLVILRHPLFHFVIYSEVKIMKKIKQAIAAGVISLAVIFTGGAVFADHSGDKEIAVVKKGDTLYSLAKKHHMSVAQISDLNDLEGTTIYPGQRLILSGEEAGYHKIIAGSFSKKRMRKSGQHY